MSLRTRLGRLEGFLPRGAPREPREAILGRLNAKLNQMASRMDPDTVEALRDVDVDDLRRRILERVRR